MHFVTAIWACSTLSAVSSSLAILAIYTRLGQAISLPPVIEFAPFLHSHGHPSRSSNAKVLSRLVYQSGWFFLFPPPHRHHLHQQRTVLGPIALAIIFAKIWLLQQPERLWHSFISFHFISFHFISSCSYDCELPNRCCSFQEGHLLVQSQASVLSLNSKQHTPSHFDEGHVNTLLLPLFRLPLTRDDQIFCSPDRYKLLFGLLLLASSCLVMLVMDASWNSLVVWLVHKPWWYYYIQPSLQEMGRQHLAFYQPRFRFHFFHCSLGWVGLGWVVLHRSWIIWKFEKSESFVAGSQHFSSHWTFASISLHTATNSMW